MIRVSLILSILWIWSSSLFAQIGGPDCTVAATLPITLPFNSLVESTCGMVNDYHSKNIVQFCDDEAIPFTDGADKLYAFTPVTSGSMIMYYQGVGVEDSSSLFVFEGCPTDPLTKCIGYNIEFSSIKNLGVIVEKGKTYYVMVDRFVSSKNDTCILQYSLNIGEVNPFCDQFLAQTSNIVNNLDFERGNFNLWTGGTGMCCPNNPNNAGIVNGRHTITSGNGTDPYTDGRVPVVAPGGGNYSARLGNSNVGAEAERLSYSFIVTGRTNSLLYKYAVVLEDPGHAPEDQPRFEINVYNNKGDLINCGHYLVVAGPKIPCFKVGTSGVLYKEWTTVGVDLSSEIGKKVTVEYTANDCGAGGHFGYAYLDVTALKLQITTEGNYCDPKTDSVFLIAPPGFATYNWSTGETNDTIKVKPLPGKTYSVDITSIQDNSCIKTLTITFDPNATTKANFTLPSKICLGDTAQFQDQSTKNGNGVDFAQYIWDFGDGAISYENNPEHVYKKEGTFNVRLIVVNNFGCKDTIIKTIIVDKNIDIPNPQCATVTPVSIEVNWDPIPNAQGYLVSEDLGSDWRTPSSGLFGTKHVMSNLIPNTDYKVLVKAQSPAPCKYTLPGEIECKTLPCPKLNLNISVSDSTIDLGQSAKISVNPLGGIGPYKYLWTPGELNGPGPYDLKPDSTTKYIITVTDIATGCITKDSVIIYVGCPSTSLKINLNDTLIKQGSSTQIKANVTGGVGPFKYTWIPNIGNGPGPFTVTPDSTKTYKVFIQDIGANNCPNYNDSVKLKVYCAAIGLKAVLSDSVVNTGSSVQLEAKINGGVGPFTYIWDPNIGNGPGPYTVLADSSKKFKVLVEDKGTKNCPLEEDSVSLRVTDECIFKFYLPDAFSPNGDGVMDGFIGTGKCIAEYSMKIFDRWGQEMFQTNDYQLAWNGGRKNNINNQVKTGVYPYFVKVKDFEGKVYTFKGLVSVTR